MMKPRSVPIGTQKKIREKVNYYDAISKSYNELHREEQIAKLNIIKSYLDETKFFKGVGNILDVGCGTGIATEFFQKMNFPVIGIDPSQGLLNQTEQSGKKGKFFCAPAENLPFHDKSFDAVISLTAIQNFSDLERGFDEIIRVCKKKAILTFLSNVKLHDEIKKLIMEKFNVIHHISCKDEIFFVEIG